jgi:hypothetical protein
VLCQADHFEPQLAAIDLAQEKTLSRKLKTAAAAAATAALLLAAGGAPGASASTGASPALFQVGTSVVNITPHKPMPDGGYGSDYIVTGGDHDPLQVRAFFVGQGKHAVVFVTVDSQGWFAAYQSPNVGDGGDDARRDAAAALAARGYDVTAANIVLSATHDHAAPTLMGLWGHTDPAYLHEVREAAVQAAVQASEHTHTAQLWSATGTIHGLLSTLQGTDQTAGFSVDDQMPILWARQPGTGATIAMYTDVPIHADQYDPTAAGNNQWSADYPGWVRDRLAQLFGGTEVVAVGTLGRQESIGSDPHYSEVVKQGQFITNQIVRALSHAVPVTSDRVAAANVPFTTEASNLGLLAAISCNHPDGPLGCPGGLNEPASNHGQGTWDWSSVGGIFTINRSLKAPYFTKSGLKIGSSATVARVGDQVYATVPGEGFAEVTEAIERAFASSPGIQAAHVIDEGSDTLGYFGSPNWAGYPANQLEGDLKTNNVGPDVGQDDLNATVKAGDYLGLHPTAEHVTADQTNAKAWSEPGIQFYPNQVETDDPTVSFYGSAHAADPASGSSSTTIGSTAGTQGDNAISWNFGDGTTAVRPDEARFTHTFPGPGLYAVRASVTDNLGKTYSWTQSVLIDSPLAAVVAQKPGPGNTVVLTAEAKGGAGTVVAAHWKFVDGTTARGTTITRSRMHPYGAVMITDGAGDTSTTSFRVS